jgi:2-dehydropantoate 2-reductase
MRNATMNQTSQPRIAVVGTGANGAAIGADLVRAGLDVTFIEQWPAHVEAMRADGIHVRMPDADETTRVKAIHLCEVATLREPFDVVLLLVKAYDTRWACELIKPLIKPRGLVVGLQNGMTLNDMADVVGAERTLGAVIEVASTMFRPGEVQRDTTRSKSWFAVGASGPATTGREPEIASILRHSGTVEISTDIRSSKWMKLIANAAELVPSAILDMTVMEAVKVPGMRDLMLEAGREAARTATALGHRMVPILGISEEQVTEPEVFAETLLTVVHDEYSIPGQKTTVLQDWIKGRRSEVHEINGLVVREQQRLGGRAPVNQIIIDIAERIESGGLDRGPANLDLLLEPARQVTVNSAP